MESYISKPAPISPTNTWGQLPTKIQITKKIANNKLTNVKDLFKFIQKIC